MNFLYLPFLWLTVACGGSTTSQKSASAEIKVKEPVVVPTFNADSAYQYVAAQMAFGNRIPNTESHRKTAEWLASELRRHGAEVIVQNAPV
ncbi:MAG: glutamine cyclotransferase, partial [Bacteroidales bacterium]